MFRAENDLPDAKMITAKFDKRMGLNWNIGNLVHMVNGWIDSYACYLNLPEMAKEKTLLERITERLLFLSKRYLTSKREYKTPIFSKRRLNYYEAHAFCFLRDMWLPQPTRTDSYYKLLDLQEIKGVCGDNQCWFDYTRLDNEHECNMLDGSIYVEYYDLPIVRGNHL